MPAESQTYPQCDFGHDGTHRRCSERAYTKNPALCPKHRREYAQKTRKYKQSSTQVDQLAAQAEGSDAALVAQLDKMIRETQDRIGALDAEIEGRTEHHTLFFREHNYGHAKWLAHRKEERTKAQARLHELRDSLAKYSGSTEPPPAPTPPPTSHPPTPNPPPTSHTVSSSHLDLKPDQRAVNGTQSRALGESTNDLPTSARMSPGPAPPPAETTSVVHNARTVSASAQNAGCAGTAERNGVRTAQLGQQMPVRGRSLLTTHPLQSTTVAPPSALATPASGAFRAQERNGASGRAETWSAAGYGTAVILKVPRAREDLEGQRTLVPAESGDGRTCGPELWEVLVAIALLVLLVQWVTGKL